MTKVSPDADVAHSAGRTRSGSLLVISSLAIPLLMAPSLLILTDFFQAANGALDFATNLSVPLGARLVLLHVRRDALLDPEMFTGALSNLTTEGIRRALNSLTSSLPVPVVAEVGHGQVAGAVADAVHRHHPTLIVLGRSDTESVPDELVQTTALDILRLAPYPMLVVPHLMAHATLPRCILLAVDGETFTLGEHAGAMRHLLDVLHAEVTVLHVSAEKPPEATATDALESVLRTGLTVDLQQQVHLRQAIAPHPAEGILQAARSSDFDLVVLLARPRSFWGELFHHSVTAEVLRHSPLPVLVLPTMD